MQAVTEPFLHRDREGRILTLTFNRPGGRNALGSLRDCQEVIDAVDAAQEDAGVSCIILTGAGASFSAGGNVKGMKTRSGLGRQESPVATRANYRRGVQRMVQAIWECEVPMIAAINGHAVGLGLDLACLCDMRIASESAKFAASFIKVGIVPGDGGAWILPRAIGLARAAEMIFTGEAIDAPTALALGLVSRVVPGERLLDEARALAQSVVANPPRALRLAKRLLREGQQQRLGDVLELSAALQAIVHETRDHAEAVDAFIEKREPHFTGE